jgi:hypothetical protein
MALGLCAESLVGSIRSGMCDWGIVYRIRVFWASLRGIFKGNVYMWWMEIGHAKGGF